MTDVAREHSVSDLAEEALHRLSAWASAIPFHPNPIVDPECMTFGFSLPELAGYSFLFEAPPCVLRIKRGGDEEFRFEEEAGWERMLGDIALTKLMGGEASVRISEGRVPQWVHGALCWLLAAPRD